MNIDRFASFCSAFTKAALATGAGALVGFAGVNAVENLEQATLQQCADQDWPAHQHDAHVEFCEAYVGHAATYSNAGAYGVK